jgi:hypothetical protein
MYHDLKQRFWWTKMKIEIARYVARCDTCQKVKAIHLKSAGELQPLPIPAWKWDDISMDFIVGLPKTSGGFDSIWVIVDRLAKSAHFLSVQSLYLAIRYAKLILKESSVFMGYQRPLYLIEVRSLSTNFGDTCMSH